MFNYKADLNHQAKIKGVLTGHTPLFINELSLRLIPALKYHLEEERVVMLIHKLFMLESSGIGLSILRYETYQHNSATLNLGSTMTTVGSKR